MTSLNRPSADCFCSAWIPNTELSLLDVHSDVVKTPIEKGKSKTLLQAYKKAADNEDLNHFKGMLADHQKALEADLQEREELDKERAAKKAKKGSRKSDVLVNDDDEMDVDEDVVPEKPKSKKRKKAEDSEDVDEKVGSTYPLSIDYGVTKRPSRRRLQKRLPN